MKILNGDTDLSNCAGIKSEIKSANFESNCTKGFENIAVMFRLTSVRICNLVQNFDFRVSHFGPVLCSK